MSKKLELPESLYETLQQAAEAEGTTPAGWIKTHLSRDQNIGERPIKIKKKPLSLADLFSCRVGQIRSGGKEALSEECGDKFTDYLEEKRHGGHL